MGVLFIHMKGGAGMRITDYGIVSCWYERDLIHKCDQEVRQRQRLNKKRLQHNKVKLGRKDADRK